MLHLAQVAFFKPIIDRLEVSGCRTESILRSCELNKYNLEKTTNYVPMVTLCSFLESAERRHGLNGFLEQFGDLMALDKIPDFMNLIIHSHDLLMACKKAANNADIVFTNEEAIFRIDGAYTTFGSRFHYNNLAGHHHVEALNLAMLINVFRQLIGSDWNPIEIHLQQKPFLGIESLMTAGHKTKVYPEQRFTAVTFPTDLLTKPLANCCQHADQSDSRPPRNISLTLKINQLLNSNSQEILPNIEHFATVACMNVRTLQRKLAAEETTFSTIIDQWRFRTAIELLSDSKTLVKDVYRHLGYSDVSNFERAFRRWTNISPGKYRQSLPS